jgi:serine/threonine protein kinase, bacterial
MRRPCVAYYPLAAAEAYTRSPATGTTRPTRTQNPTPRTFEPPPLVQGQDTYGESCDQGFSHPTATGWAGHAGRGTPETSCYFTDSVLQAYWAQYPAPSRDRRTVTAAGRVPCSTTGGTCAGTDYVMECQALGSEDWIACTGGQNARVYLY